MSEQWSRLIDDVIDLRKSKGMTQQQLSDVCGLTQSVIARIESKRSAPTISTLYKIVSALGTELVIQR